ncbi:MAG: pyridoxamine 5'-phosphate oxidase [Streptosporangiaceae bacterium]|nr:pyridoxamine 5'-phosphate oxidase [Streptosporangiaceae bacterium]
MTDSERDLGGLSPDMMADEPMEQFARWMAEAAEVLPEPTAMVLATISAEGRPRARTVLLKAHGREGLTFYTNRTSRKGQDLAGNPRACVVFPWYGLHRQVTVEGTVTMMSQADSEAYFRSRPHGSQLSAWASRQSTVLESRKQLDDRAAELERRWPEGAEVPMPDFWRGYVLEPETAEFWQGRQYRLHDRLRYRRDGAGGDGARWIIERLSP